VSTRILVTGAGSVVGQGIIKALRLSGLDVTLVAGDISELNAALYRADEAVLLPPVESDDALARIIAHISSLAIDGILIGSEFDLAFFAEHRAIIEQHTGARVVVSSPKMVALADDKLATANWLTDNGLPTARSYGVNSIDGARRAVEAVGLPCILKARRGTSGRNVQLITDLGALDFWVLRTPDPMVQQLLGTPTRTLANEYTCGLFKDSRGHLSGPIIARRTLRGGSSWVVEVCRDDEIHEMLCQLAELAPFRGPFNVQLVKTEQGPVPFEFNARFSGTTAIRAHFGFNDAALAVSDFVLGSPQPALDWVPGLALRYEEEIFLNGVAAEEVKMPLPRGEIHRWF
jgi:carbamoyl-phosphate synthase large subunit